MKVWASSGMRNTVSTVEDRWRFMCAICISYSKSETARRPRMMATARLRAT